jgi:inner membrane protein
MNQHEGPARTDGLSGALRRSAVLRLSILALLALVLQIPLRMVGQAITERQVLRNEAVSEVSGKWGKSQVLRGPLLVVPFLKREVQIDQEGKRTIVQTHEVARFLPDQLEIDGDLAGEVRYRGIFRVPVYRARLQLKATFGAIDFSRWRVGANDVQWDQAYLSLRLTDPRALVQGVTLRRADQRLPFRPSAGQWEENAGGIHVPLDARAAEHLGPVELDITIRGSRSLAFAPVGGTTDVHLESPWPDPSFDGNWLPASRRVSESGFSAHWSIPSLGRDYPQSWMGRRFDNALKSSTLGVSLITAVDPYRMSERSQKYQLLFIGLTFLTLWLFEVLAGCRIHPIQYLLVGSALCLFYLLELALAEHLGFGLAYGLAAGSVALVITLYAAAILRQRRRSLGLGGVICGLYGYLYAVLSSENYALLAGAVALLATLGAVMYLTRNTNWYELGQRLAPNDEQPVIDPVEEAFEKLGR